MFRKWSGCWDNIFWQMCKWLGIWNNIFCSSDNFENDVDNYQKALGYDVSGNSRQEVRLQ